jgi:hypothetical protein
LDYDDWSRWIESRAIALARVILIYIGPHYENLIVEVGNL